MKPLFAAASAPVVLAALMLAALMLAAPALAAKKPVPKAPPPPPAPTAADFRPLDPENTLVVDTNKGRIVVELYPAIAPNHVARIKTLAHQHFYDGLNFFRVIDDFMDQTGDPTNKGDGDSTLPNLKAEFTFRRDAATPFTAVARPDDGAIGFVGVMPVMSQPDDMMLMTADGKAAAWTLFCPGVMGMARSGDPDSANSQFFFMRGPYPSLDKKYTAWGRVVAGEAVVKSIKIGEPVPDPQDRMLTVRLASDLAPAERPKLYVLDTRTPAFQGIVAKARADKGADFSACDVEIPTETR